MTRFPGLRSTELLLSTLFFVSGFAAILYQIVWQRMLFALIGINIEVVTLIVTLFIGGLGVGSLLGGAALSPLLETVPVSSGEINPFSIFTASATALAALTITDMVHKRFGV